MPRLVIAESAPYAAAAKTLRTWINKWLGTHSDKTYREFDFAELAGRINPALWSKIRAGKGQPTSEQCLGIAYWLGIPVDQVMRLWGYPDLKMLRAQVIQAHDHSDEDKTFITTMLDVAMGAQWQRLDPHKSPQRGYADFVLSRSSRELEGYAKAESYAFQVYSWLTDPQRNIVIGRRKTDEIVKSIAL